VRGPRLDQTDLQTPLDAPEPFAQQQLADPALAVVGVNRQAAELPHEVGMGADLQVDRGSADDFPRLGVLGHEEQAAVGVNEPGQERVVVVARVGVVGPVSGKEDLADRSNVAASRLADGDHDWSSKEGAARGILVFKNAARCSASSVPTRVLPP
jgi:hypothetical protein